MRTRALLGLSTVLVVTTFVGGSGAHGDGLTVGSTPPSPLDPSSCLGPSIFFQDATATPPTYETTSGVITSWSVMPDTSPVGVVQLAIGREAIPSSYTIQGTSEPRQVSGTSLNTFRTRIPVAAGDKLGLYVSTAGPSPCFFTTGPLGDVMRFATGPTTSPAVGSTIATTNSQAGDRVDVSALIEPDADGDGYGDLSQDACPALPKSHTDCLAPDTSVIKPETVRTAKKTAKVKLTFYASESGTTFTCSLDGAAPKPCTSPFVAKVKVGKHRLGVVATDAVGNVEVTPALVTFKVKKSRR